jgi:NhaA family Na+:H+ antiporter
MATDIAFALGVLALLGRRVPTSLRILLLSLAIVDDIGAILVIALFYSPGFDPSGLTICVIGVILVRVLQVFGVRNAWFYVIPALVIWGGAAKAGIHPSLAGVIVGLMTPVRAWFGRDGFLEEARARVDLLGATDSEDERDLVPHLQSLEQAGREAISPVERLIQALHGWVAFGVLPLFAFANAGVTLERVEFAPDAQPIFFGICVGLLLGKPLGIFGLSWLAQKARWADLPNDLTWRHIVLVGILGGIGFTMSIFIAGLAFPDGNTLEMAKVAILASSTLAAVVGLFLGWASLKQPRAEAEAG